VTGAGGFVGRAVVEELARRGHRVLALAHRAAVPPPAEPVHGDLLDPTTYQERLRGADAVLHLAAATGKALPADHHRVNAEGTRALAAACRAAGGRRLLFVSSVAAGFPATARYPYALAKALAESAVAASGVPYLIARPTIVVGPGSAVLAGLRKLAGLPVMPVFGSGAVKVQPVWVGDLAAVLVDCMEQGRFDGATIGIGGPETPTIEEFMIAIRRSLGRGDGPLMHLPLALVLPPLAALETVAYRFLPVTVGQLASFRFDGTVPAHPLVDARRASMRSVQGMLAASVT
jgi:nucleoside-diphosphate-sugar epimerase